MTISFRPTLMEDAPLLKEWLSHPEVLRWFPMANEREIDDSVRVWISYSKFESGLTVLYNGVPCGMANLYIQPFVKLAHQCLFSIVVAQEYRGKGVGTALLTELIRFAKDRFNIEILHLEVYEGNPARRLYSRLGFKEFGIQKHFIRDHGQYVGKVFMQKILKEYNPSPIGRG